MESKKKSTVLQAVCISIDDSSIRIMSQIKHTYIIGLALHSFSLSKNEGKEFARKREREKK